MDLNAEVTDAQTSYERRLREIMNAAPEKPFDEQAILDAVRTALEQTDDVVDVELTSRLASLSERERQVLEGLVAGQANKMIAATLGISPRTVEVYRANLMAKMQANSLSELIRMAILAHVP